MAIVCKLNNFTLQREEVSIFTPISFAVYAGEVWEIIGSNGIGKTSLLEFLAFKNLSYCGQYQIQQVPFYLSINNIADYQCTVLDNIKFWQTLYSVSTSVMQAAINFWNFNNLLDIITYSLSTGQKARLNLLRLSLVDQQLLLLDEPLSFLDTDSINLFKTFIINFLNTKGSVIIASNNVLNLGKKLYLH